VLAWSAIPLDTFLGGLAIEYTGDAALVYSVIDVLIFLIPFGCSFTALGHADRYLLQGEKVTAEGTVQPATG
jgi:hypothetical protein